MSGDGCTSSDQVIAKLIEMGFDNSTVIEAVKAVGLSYNNAIEYILNGSHENCKGTKISTSSGKTLGKRAFSATSSGGQMRQSSLLDHLRSGTRPKQSRSDVVSDVSISRSVALPSIAEEHKEPYSDINCSLETEPASLPVLFPEEVDIGSDWEMKVNSLLQKHFGYSSLKNFQKEALSAWFSHQDCLVLAATGSGKSLCFQIPALLTGKVVVVISPLISLMHDQCFKLSKHGVSACFLGSGQPDSSVEQKALRGMYSIVYVCPETVLRLIEPLQRLAEIRGIALFAIDEVHCVSKWGHDFRPDYRRMSILRENFNANILKFLKFDVPVMALTATATMQVREDILRSLCMSKDTKIVLTSFFRSNLRFSVKHSITTSPASYKKDFCQLIDMYIRKGKTSEKEKTSVLQELDDQSDSSASIGVSGPDRISPNYNIEDGNIDEDDDEVNSTMENVPNASWEEELSVEYLENDVDVCQNVDDWDVSCGGFNGHSPRQYWNTYGSSEINDPPDKPNERLKILQEPLEQGLTIIYVPTRKETLRIAKHLCGFGVKAAAYNASGLSLAVSSYNSEDVLVSFGGYNGRYNSEIHVLKPSHKSTLQSKIKETPVPDSISAVHNATNATRDVESEFEVGQEGKIREIVMDNIDSDPRKSKGGETTEHLIATLKSEKEELESSLSKEKLQSIQLKEELAEAETRNTELYKELQSIRGQLAAEQSRCFKLEVDVAELRQKLQAMETLQKELELLQRQKAASEQALLNAKQRHSSGGVWGPPPSEKADDA